MLVLYFYKRGTAPMFCRQVGAPAPERSILEGADPAPPGRAYAGRIPSYMTPGGLPSPRRGDELGQRAGAASPVLFDTAEASQVHGVSVLAVELVERDLMGDGLRAVDVAAWKAQGYPDCSSTSPRSSSSQSRSQPTATARAWLAAMLAGVVAGRRLRSSVMPRCRRVARRAVFDC
jgi:hypothetical protein